MKSSNTLDMTYMGLGEMSEGDCAPALIWKTKYQDCRHKLLNLMTVELKVRRLDIFYMTLMWVGKDINTLTNSFRGYHVRNII